MTIEKRVRFKSWWLPWVLLAPQVAVIAIFFFWPAAQAIIQSLQQQDAFGASVANLLDAAGFADSAARDRELALEVAAHKAVFFAESTLEVEPIDYKSAVTGALTLAPSGEAREVLAEDYARMAEDGLLLDDADPFEALLERCRALADKVNAMVRSSQ